MKLVLAARATVKMTGEGRLEISEPLKMFTCFQLATPKVQWRRRPPDGRVNYPLPDLSKFRVR